MPEVAECLDDPVAGQDVVILTASSEWAVLFAAGKPVPDPLMATAEFLSPLSKSGLLDGVLIRADLCVEPVSKGLDVAVSQRVVGARERPGGGLQVSGKLVGGLGRLAVLVMSPIF